MLSTILDDLYDLNRNITRIFDASSKYKYYYWPEVNIYSSIDEFVVIAKLPGVKKENVSIVLKDNSLKISGEKEKEEKENTGCYLDERYIEPVPNLNIFSIKYSQIYYINFNKSYFFHLVFFINFFNENPIFRNAKRDLSYHFLKIIFFYYQAIFLSCICSTLIFANLANTHKL